MITHDLGVIAETAQRVVVMYAGRVVEEASTQALFEDPLHPYTQGLLRSVPRMGQRARHGRERLAEISGVVPSLYDLPEGCTFHPRCRRPKRSAAARCQQLKDAGRRTTHPLLAQRVRTMTDRLLEVENLKVHFPVKRGVLSRTVGYVHAVDGVSLHVGDGGNAGDRRRKRLRQDDHGHGGAAPDRAHGRPGDASRASTSPPWTGARWTDLRKRMQIIFQDPYSSLNPRMTVRHILGDPMRIHGLYPRPGVRGTGRLPDGESRV